MGVKKLSRLVAVGGALDTAPGEARRDPVGDDVALEADALAAVDVPEPDDLAVPERLDPDLAEALDGTVGGALGLEVRRGEEKGNAAAPEQREQ